MERTIIIDKTYFVDTSKGLDENFEDFLKEDNQSNQENNQENNQKTKENQEDIKENIQEDTQDILKDVRETDVSETNLFSLIENNETITVKSKKLRNELH